MGLAGWATARASAAELAALRKDAAFPVETALSPGFLKNSDDQTVLSLAAVCRAIASMKSPATAYGAWGLVAAANLFGRAGTFHALLDFHKDGPWGITPHMIPHHSLHAVSGTISQALQIHGPNFGIGGGAKAVAEAFLVAATMLSENDQPGLWMVLSGHDPECIPSAKYQEGQAPIPCLSAALALQPPTSNTFTRCIRVDISADEPPNHADLSLTDLLAVLEADVSFSRWKLPGCGWVEFDRPSILRSLQSRR
jgi:hypothetical protein